MVVVAPTEAGPNEGYRFTERERRSALSALRWARRRLDVDENRVFVAVDWVAFLSGCRRDPAAREVVRRAAAPGEGRALWAEVLATDAAVSEAVAPPQPAGWEGYSEDAKRKYFVFEAEKRAARLAV